MADRDVIPYSFDGNQINDGINYSAGMYPGVEWGLPGVQMNTMPRQRSWPVVTAVTRNTRDLRLWIKIVGSNKRSLRDQLMRWFDPEAETTALFVIRDEDGTNGRYVNALCSSFEPIVANGIALRDLFLVTLVVDGDVRWRSTSLSSDSWSITASGDTEVIANNGNDNAYPSFSITPTSYKSGSADWTYQMFVAVVWRATTSASTYPVDIVNNTFDTDALVTASKMQADGDDLRVKVDGTEVDRWIQDINTTTTQVWVNLDWEAGWSGTITAAIGSGDSVSSIIVNESTSAMPSSGILIINSEVFIYTSKNDSTKAFTISERAAKGSTAAGHSASAAIYWVQHDINVLYGNPGASAPTVDSDYQPIIELTSSNTSWVYQEFGNDDETRPGSWAFTAISNTPVAYTANRNTDADPWEELGIALDSWTDVGMWKLTNPCLITAGNFTNGEQYAEDTSQWLGKINSYGYVEYTIPAPSSASTWESWSRNETLVASSTEIYVTFRGISSSNVMYLEFADCTITLDSSNTPVCTSMAERASYALTCTIENTTTGDSISIDYSELDIDESITIDTDARTVVNDQDGTSQLQALTLDGGPRRDWLALARGNNTLQFTDANTAGVTIDYEFRERFH